jgi:hypothetical protein
MVSQYIFDLSRICVYIQGLDYTLLAQLEIEEFLFHHSVDVAGVHSDPAVPMPLKYPVSLF